MGWAPLWRIYLCFSLPLLSHPWVSLIWGVEGDYDHGGTVIGKGSHCPSCLASLESAHRSSERGCPQASFFLHSNPLHCQTSRSHIPLVFAAGKSLWSQIQVGPWFGWISWEGDSFWSHQSLAKLGGLFWHCKRNQNTQPTPVSLYGRHCMLLALVLPHQVFQDGLCWSWCQQTHCLAQHPSVLLQPLSRLLCGHCLAEHPSSCIPFSASPWMVPALTGCRLLSQDGEQGLKPKLWSCLQSCTSDQRSVPLGASPWHQSQSLSIPFSVDPEDFALWFWVPRVWQFLGWQFLQLLLSPWSSRPDSTRRNPHCSLQEERSERL